MSPWISGLLWIWIPKLGRPVIKIELDWEWLLTSINWKQLSWIWPMLHDIGNAFKNIGSKFFSYKWNFKPGKFKFSPVCGGCFQWLEVNAHIHLVLFMTGLPNFGTQIHHNPEIHGLNFQFLEGNSIESRIWWNQWKI